MSVLDTMATSETISYPMGPITSHRSYYVLTKNTPHLGSAVFITSHHWSFLLLSPIIFLSVVGNVLVCVVISMTPKLRTTNNIFLLSLAAADLMVAVFVMPLGLIKDFYGLWPSSPTLCSIWATLDVLCCTASILHITVISLDRFFAIYDPIRFRLKRRRLSSALYRIIFVWMTSATLSSPLLVLGLNGQAEVIDYYYCAITSQHFKIYGSAVAFFIPFTVVVVTYLLTALTLHGSKSRQFRSISIHRNKFNTTYRTISKTSCWHCNVEPERPAISMGHQNKGTLPPIFRSQSSNLTATVGTLQRNNSHLIRKMSVITHIRNFNQNKQRANQVLFLIFVAFVLAWTPFFVANIFYAFYVKHETPSIIFTSLTWLGWASSMVNPVVYTAFNSKFRSAIWTVLTCKWSRLNETVSSQSLSRRQYL